jgi:hypothetical protein
VTVRRGRNERQTGEQTMSQCSLERLISHAIRRLNETERKAERDPSAQEEVEFWAARVIRLIDKQDSKT